MRGHDRLSFVGFSLGAALLAVVFAGMTVLDRTSAIPLLWSVLVRCMVILLLCFVVEFTDSRARLFGGRPAWRTLLWCLLPPLFALLASYGVVNTHPGLVKGMMIALNVLATVVVEELYYRFFGLYLFRQKKENPILPILLISLVWGLSYLANLVG
ncbi:MAG: type II CAAX prenyl endopeptidase Rce1 family protein, partial [Eubacteriales bacterium]